MTRSPHGPPAQKDDWVRVSIREDGTFHFATYRIIGEFRETDRSVLKDGKLVARGDRGRVTCALYAAEGGHRMLRAMWVEIDGMEYSADLTPAH